MNLFQCKKTLSSFSYLSSLAVKSSIVFCKPAIIEMRAEISNWDIILNIFFIFHREQCVCLMVGFSLNPLKNDYYIKTSKDFFVKVKLGENPKSYFICCCAWHSFCKNLINHFFFRNHKLSFFLLSWLSNILDKINKNLIK